MKELIEIERHFIQATCYEVEVASDPITPARESATQFPGHRKVQLAKTIMLSPIAGPCCSSALREMSSVCSVMYFE